MMMMYTFIRTSRFALVALLACGVSAQNSSPLQIPFNTSGSHGPDGPWNYITLSIGSGPASSVDFYPMLSDQTSLLVTQDACKNSSCISPKPGYFDSGSSSVTDNPQGINTSTLTVTQYDGGIADQLGLAGSGFYYADSINGEPMSANNVSFFVSGNITAQDSSNGVPFTPVSLLSLEANTNNSPIKTNNSGSASDQTLLEAYSNGTGGSIAFGLHIGSASFQQPGSLYFGGFDSNRLIERPAYFSQFGYVPLNNISFATASGDNPWTTKYKSKYGDLPANFLPGGAAQVTLSPQHPHMYFPQSVCNMMQEYLPISFDQTTNLYLWNTSDPAYHDIVSSPSYMNFTFGDDQNTSIRIPFALLNLTLTSPLKDKPTPYFPCTGRMNAWNLGRAFLQGALLIQGYHDNGVIAVGQAPGPSINASTKPNPMQLIQNNPDPQPPTNAPKWEDTWSGVLKPFDASSSSSSSAGSSSTGGSASNSPNAAPNGSSSGLSGGAIAGIVIGVLAGIGLVAAAVAFICLKKRRSKRKGKKAANTDTGARPDTSQSDVPPPPPPKEEKVFYPNNSALGSTRSVSASSPNGPSRGTPTAAGSGAGSVAGANPAWGAIPASGTSASGGPHEILSSEVQPHNEMEADLVSPVTAVAHELPGDPGRRQPPVEMDAGNIPKP